jgi:hypothetical protein
MADVDAATLRSIAYAWLYITVNEATHSDAPKLLASEGFPQDLLDSIRQSVSIANQVAIHTNTTSAFQKVAAIFTQISPLSDTWGADEHPKKSELNSIFIAPVAAAPGAGD